MITTTPPSRLWRWLSGCKPRSGIRSVILGFRSWVNALHQWATHIDPHRLRKTNMWQPSILLFILLLCIIILFVCFILCFTLLCFYVSLYYVLLALQFNCACLIGMNMYVLLVCMVLISMNIKILFLFGKVNSVHA